MNDYKFKYRDFAEALYDALIPDSFYFTLEKLIQGNSSIRKEAMLKYFDYSMLESEKYGCLFIPSEHKYGVSVWSKPVNTNVELEIKTKKKDFLLRYWGQNALDTYLSVADFMGEKSASLIPPKSWYLSIVGLKPSFQGKGLGAGLINPILEKSDRQKVCTYLETYTPRNMKFYERLGYETIGSFHEPIINSQYWIMLRSTK